MNALLGDAFARRHLRTGGVQAPQLLLPKGYEGRRVTQDGMAIEAVVLGPEAPLGAIQKLYWRARWAHGLAASLAVLALCSHALGLEISARAEIMLVVGVRFALQPLLVRLMWRRPVAKLLRGQPVTTLHLNLHEVLVARRDSLRMAPLEQMVVASLGLMASAALIHQVKPSLTPALHWALAQGGPTPSAAEGGWLAAVLLSTFGLSAWLLSWPLAQAFGPGPRRALWVSASAGLAAALWALVP